MREILFKAKRVDNGEWIEGGHVLQTDYYGIEVDRCYIIDGTDTEDYDIGPKYRVDPDTISQYTGRIDKNGNKIWENDVVNKVDTNALGWYRERKCKVSFDGLGYWLLTTEYGDGYWLGEFNAEQLEVIGNIFDNPEMMEVQE